MRGGMPVRLFRDRCSARDCAPRPRGNLAAVPSGEALDVHDLRAVEHSQVHGLVCRLVEVLHERHRGFADHAALERELPELEQSNARAKLRPRSFERSATLELERNPIAVDVLKPVLDAISLVVSSGSDAENTPRTAKARPITLEGGTGVALRLGCGSDLARLAILPTDWEA